MKRIVILIDGTWNKEGIAGNTNVATLDPSNRIVAQAFIRTTAADGVAQHVHYHDGVGAGRSVQETAWWRNRPWAQANHSRVLRFCGH